MFSYFSSVPYIVTCTNCMLDKLIALPIPIVLTLIKYPWMAKIKLFTTGS